VTTLAIVRKSAGEQEVGQRKLTRPPGGEERPAGSIATPPEDG
jgi:hypothetical protein